MIVARFRGTDCCKRGSGNDWMCVNANHFTPEIAQSSRGYQCLSKDAQVQEDTFAWAPRFDANKAIA